MNGIDWNALKMATPGQIPPRVWNKLIDSCATLELIQVNGGDLDSLFGVGSTLNIKTKGGGSAVPAHPWKMYDACVNNDSEHTAKLRVNSGDGWIGMINNIVANVSGNPINYVNPTDGSAPAPPLLTDFDSDGYYFVYCEIKLNDDKTDIERDDMNGVTLKLFFVGDFGAWSGSSPMDLIDPEEGIVNLAIGTAVLETNPDTGNKKITPIQGIRECLWFSMCGGMPQFGGMAAGAP